MIRDNHPVAGDGTGQDGVRPAAGLPAPGPDGLVPPDGAGPAAAAPAARTPSRTGVPDAAGVPGAGTRRPGPPAGRAAEPSATADRGPGRDDGPPDGDPHEDPHGGAPEAPHGGAPEAPHGGAPEAPHGGQPAPHADPSPPGAPADLPPDSPRPEPAAHGDGGTPAEGGATSVESDGTPAQGDGTPAESDGTPVEGGTPPQAASAPADADRPAGPRRPHEGDTPPDTSAPRADQPPSDGRRDGDAPGRGPSPDDPAASVPAGPSDAAAPSDAATPDAAPSGAADSGPTDSGPAASDPAPPDPAEPSRPGVPSGTGEARPAGAGLVRAGWAATVGHVGAGGFVRRRPSGAHATGAGERSEQVAVDEPILSARVHRPADLLRFMTGVVGLAVVLAIAGFAHGTTSGVEQDIARGTTHAPGFLISFAGFTASVAVLIVPVAFAVERLIKRDGLRVADGVLAAVLAHGISLGADLWVTGAAPAAIRDALTQTAPGGGITDPVHGYLAPVIAYMTAVGMARRPRWRVALWCVLLLDAFAVLVGGYTTPFSIVFTVLIGWTVAYGTVYAVGSPNVRPTGQTLLAGLRRVGFTPVTAQRLEDVPETSDHERGRRYLVALADGPPLDVTVVDREQQAHGYFYRAWRRLQLRGVSQRRSLQSLRQALEQEALLAYAAISAGAHAPKLIATSDLGPDAVMLVYEHIEGRSLDWLDEPELTDGVMDRAWAQVKALQSRRIAHRRLVGDSLLVDGAGKVYVTDLSSGEIAAGDIVLRMDIAQLLTTFALRVGPVRSVACAVRVLGPDAVADSLPLLQPIALSRSTRATLRQLAKARAEREREAVIEATRVRHTAGLETHSADRRVAKAQRKAEKEAEKRAMEDALEAAREEDLLSQIRQQVLQIRPQAPVQPVRLERFKARTIISFIAGAIAAYFLLSQFAQLHWSELIGTADWAWVAASLLLSAATYVPATMSLLGFVPEKVPFGRTMLAQVAGNFVKLVAPAAVGGVALNTRFLQRNGVRPGLAVASVGAAQLASLGGHILLLATFGYLTGTQHAPSLSPSRTVIAGLLTAAVLVLVASAVPPLRRFVASRVRSLFAGVVPRMLDMLQRPRKLVTGAGGVLLLTLVNVACLDASVRAFDFTSLSFASVAVVFLVANAAGSAVPSPGGVGAIEAALSGALTIAGMPADKALSAVLLFRLVTFWLPVLPGWLCFTHLTRKGEL